MIERPPYIKLRNFVPNPIAKHGIPKFADSRANPKVIGTPQWEAWWLEQIHYCTFGTTIAGRRIPGFYYYYLNFNSMATVSGIISPDIVDLHLELAYLYEYAEINHKNVLCAKKRRAGISEFTQKYVDWRFRFTNGAFTAGIAAGQEIFALDFMRKWRLGESNLPPEIRTKKLKENDSEVVAGYKFRNGQGELVDDGTRNTLFIRTMFKSPALFKGLPLQLVVAEECGEFEHLKKFYQHTRPCVLDGANQKGSMFFYGTGGNMQKGGKDFADLWDQADNYNFIRFLIPAARFHKPFYGGCKTDEPQTPYLLEQYSPHEIIGVEDLKAAEEAILKERADILKSKDLDRYQEHLRDYPMTKEDIFSLNVDNDFDREILNNQRNKISSEQSKYVVCQLEWKKDKNGEVIHPREVEAKLDSHIDENGVCVLIHADHYPPIKGYANLYCGAADSYDQDRAKTSKSKGAACILVRRNDIPGCLQMAPVATICCRPHRKEIFYDMVLKLAVYFGLQESMLIDVANKLIFDWFEQNGYTNLLAYRPKKFESENSEQTHTFGVHLNNYSKPLMVGLMQTNIIDWGHNIWFPELINQLANYNQVTIGSDNDLADAYGIALIQNVNEGIPARSMKDYTDEKIYHTPVWYTDSNGNKRMRNGSSVNGDLLPKEDFRQGRFGEY